MRLSSNGKAFGRFTLSEAKGYSGMALASSTEASGKQSKPHVSQSQFVERTQKFTPLLVIRKELSVPQILGSNSHLDKHRHDQSKIEICFPFWLLPSWLRATWTDSAPAKM
jgi:hypothetical protein